MPDQDSANLLRLIISRGLRLRARGILFGIMAALGLTRLLGQLLYNVSPCDPVVFTLGLAGMTPLPSSHAYCALGGQAGLILRVSLRD